MSIYQHIENILNYAIIHLELNEKDVVYKRNILFDVFNLDGTSDVFKPIDTKTFETATSLLKPLTAYALEHKIISSDKVEYLETKVMGILSLTPSQVEDKFNSFSNKVDATNWFYQYCVKNNYVQKDAIDKNIIWQSHHHENPLTITINLTKPEKNNKDIKKLLTLKQNNYPKTVLSKENVGYRGHAKHASRQNIRVIDVVLNGENWFWQYSPYAYYKEHMIVINEAVVPMVVNRSTLIKLIDFVDQYPHYFLGSNASLPIIGGSILNHEHYQGGLEKLPMHYAKPLVQFKNDTYKDVTVSILDWYNSVIQIKSKNKSDLLEVATKYLDAWSTYNHQALNILSHTDGVKHNAAAVIVRKVDDGYTLDMILRNNRTNEHYPDGIFHAHPKYHHIKSEGIGLIEAMGLFILPPRLKRELQSITQLLQMPKLTIDDIPSNLDIHKAWIMDLEHKLNDRHLTTQAYQAYLYKEIDLICEQILYNTAVFKKDQLNEFIKFIEDEGFRRI